MERHPAALLCVQCFPTEPAVHLRRKPLRVEGNTESDYFLACTRCELPVRVQDVHTLSALRGLMKFHKKRSGVQGLALVQDFPPLMLRRGDRLEPTPAFPDIGLIFTLATLPVDLVFWRPLRETIARRRNPLFNMATGVTRHRCLTVDLLHALYLGIMKTFACHCIWFLLLSGKFGNNGGNSEERLESARLAVVHRLFQWYKARHQSHPQENLTQVYDLTRKMLGTPTARELKTKGAESWGMLLFLVDTIAVNRHKLGPEAPGLLEAGQALIALVGIWDTSGASLPDTAISRCHALWERLMDLTSGIEVVNKPKRHVFCHVISRLADQGNPKLSANWHDEALNKLLKAACRQVSQATFEGGLLRRMRALLAQRKRLRDW